MEELESIKAQGISRDDYAPLLDFGLRRLQPARDHFRLKSHSAMRAVAKRLVVAVPAAAERNHGAACQIEFIPVLIEDFEIAFEADAAIVIDRDLDGHLFSPIGIAARGGCASAPRGGQISPRRKAVVFYSLIGRFDLAEKSRAVFLFDFLRFRAKSLLTALLWTFEAALRLSSKPYR